MSESSVRGLLDAVVEIASDLSLPEVLDRIVSSSRELVGADHGALGVLGPDGTEEQRIGGIPSGQDALAVPIPVRDTVFGRLYLSKRDGEGFSARDEEMVNALTAAAGVAIENATLFEQTRLRERWLEASHQVTSALLTGQDPAGTLRLIAERARVVAGASVGAVARPREGDPSTLVFEVIESADGEQERLVGITVPAEGTATGVAFTTGQPVVVRQYGDHVVAQQADADVQLPAAVKDLDSAVAAPLTVGEETLGVLLVAKFGDKIPFTETEVQLVRAFAGHAALAVEFARAEDDRQRLAVFEDRDRIARDLHDLVIQRLFAIGLGLEGMSRLSTQPEIADRMTGFVHDLDRTIRDIRNSIFSLQEPAEVQGSLRSELLRLALDTAGLLGFEPRIGFDGPLDSAVPDSVRSDLLATLREALANVARHASATSVSVEVTVDRDGRRLTLTVVDDGVGIPDRPSRHSGLANLRERAARWGGTFAVRRAPERGTTLEWTAALRR